MPRSAIPLDLVNTPPALPDVLDPFTLAYAAVFTAGFLASSYLAGPADQPLASDAHQAHVIDHWSTVGFWLFGPGLFLLAVRFSRSTPSPSANRSGWSAALSPSSSPPSALPPGDARNQ